MQVNKVTATVKYTQETGKGAWESVELGAEATVGPGESWRVAQANLYRDLGHQLKTLWAQNGSAELQHTPEAGSGQPPEDHQAVVPPSSPPASLDGGQQRAAHFCQVHGVPFTARDGKYGEFWSHQIKGSLTWCNESNSR